MERKIKNLELKKSGILFLLLWVPASDELVSSELNVEDSRIEFQIQSFLFIFLVFAVNFGSGLFGLGAYIDKSENFALRLLHRQGIFL